jgi:hypothetical protein
LANLISLSFASFEAPPKSTAKFSRHGYRAAYMSCGAAAIAGSTGINNSAPLFFTLPTCLPTGHILRTSSGQGLSIAIRSSSLAGSSPSHFGQSLSARMIGEGKQQGRRDED